MNTTRQRFDLGVKDLGLSWFRAGFGPLQKTILQEMNFRAPAGQITAILIGLSYHLSAQLTLD